MSQINSIPQAVAPVVSSISTGQSGRKEKLPKTGQDVPTNVANVAPEQEKGNERTTEKLSEVLQKTVDNLNAYASNLDRNLSFRVDEAADRTVITVRDSETDEVIRQIPSEEVLSIARRTQAATSAIFDALA